MLVEPNFYEKIEEERRKYMKKHGLNKLTTKAFTGILVNKKWIDKKNERKKRRRK